MVNDTQVVITWMDGRQETYDARPGDVSAENGELVIEISEPADVPASHGRLQPSGPVPRVFTAIWHYPLVNIRVWKLERKL